MFAAAPLPSPGPSPSHSPLAIEVDEEPAFSEPTLNDEDDSGFPTAEDKMDDDFASAATPSSRLVLLSSFSHGESRKRPLPCAPWVSDEPVTIHLKTAILKPLSQSRYEVSKRCC